MNELALFAGAGGGLLATKWLLGWRAICYVENNPYCVEVLNARIRDGVLDDAPIWDDARTFDGRPWVGCVDIVTAGFPCQPFSVAGKMEAQDDERNLWPDTIRIIGEVEPEWCLLENTPGLLSGKHGYLGQILADLAENGYDAVWKVLSAAEVGAPHKRDRVWVVAHSHGASRTFKRQAGRVGREWEYNTEMAYTNGRGQQFDGEQEDHPAYGDSCRGYPGGRGDEMAYADQQRSPEPLPVGTSQDTRDGAFELPSWWAIEPQLGRVADGVAHRVDRLRAIGNGQVPAVVKVVWELIGSEKGQYQNQKERRLCQL